ncbi:MAG TPA: DUF4175 family protein [Planctomycetota bacterium]
MSATPHPEGYQAIRAAVLGFAGFRKRWLMLEGLGTFVLIGPGLLLLWFLLDVLLTLAAWPLLLSFLLICALSVWACVRWLLRPLLRRMQLEREALLAERLHGRLDNQIIGALQLGAEVGPAVPASARDGGQGQPPHLGHSPALVELLVQRTAARLAQTDLRGLLDLRRARKMLQAGGAVAVLVLCCLIFASSVVSQRIERLRQAYAVVLDSLFSVELRVSPGDLAVVRGKPVTLSATVIGARQSKITLLRTDVETNQATAIELPLQSWAAEFTIQATEKSFWYQFEYAGRRSARHQILVGELPELSNISYELIFPAYTGQPSRTLTGRSPKLQALAGTNTLVSLAATTELHPEMSYVEWQDGTRQALNTNGRFGHFSFTITSSARAFIHLTGKYGRGFEMAEPIAMEIAADRDNAPSVELLLKRDKTTLLAEEAASLSVPYVAEDDFGVAEVTLNYRIDAVDELLARPLRQNSVTRAMEPPRDRAKGMFADVFKGMDPPLAPGDRIRVHLTAKDNNTETGPGTGRSKTIEIIVVRPDMGQFTEKQFGFETSTLLGGLAKIKRATDLLVEPPRNVLTEKAQKVEKQTLQSRVAPELWPSGSEDAVGDYFRLMSGGK